MCQEDYPSSAAPDLPVSTESGVQKAQDVFEAAVNKLIDDSVLSSAKKINVTTLISSENENTTIGQ